MQNTSHNFTAIIGCGRLGASLADALSETDRSVLVIDRDKDSLRKLSPSFGGLTAIGDAQDLEFLRDCDLAHADVAIVVTNDDNANILIAQMIRLYFNTPQIISRLYDPERACVYEGLNIHTVSPFHLSGEYIAQLMQSASSAHAKETL